MVSSNRPCPMRSADLKLLARLVPELYSTQSNYSSSSSFEMFTFFSQCGYPCTSLEHDLRRVASVSRSDALRSSGWSDTALDRVPLVLKNHLLNTQSKQFLLQNFRLCMPQPPFVAYKRNFIPRDILSGSEINFFMRAPSGD